MNIRAALGVAIREFPLKKGHGFTDYLLYVDGRAIGLVEAKPESFTLKGVETQSSKYVDGLPDLVPTHCLPLPMSYESTSTVTQFIRPWTASGSRLEALVEGIPLERTWGNLAPRQRRAACAEFLRSHRKLRPAPSRYWQGAARGPWWLRSNPKGTLEVPPRWMRGPPQEFGDFYRRRPHVVERNLGS